MGLVGYLGEEGEVSLWRLCQDENFFGCQSTSDNPNIAEFYQNTQAPRARVVDSFCRDPVRGNCRGKNSKDPVADPKEKEKVGSYLATS